MVDDSIDKAFDDDFPLEDSLNDDSGIKNEPTGDNIVMMGFPRKMR